MKKFEISVLDLAPVKQNKTIQDTFHDSLALAQAVEKLNYKRFWLAEHHNMASIASSATSILIGYIANGTEKIKVGSGGIMLPNHSSLVIAEQFGTLESLFPGRIDLGVGRAPGTDGLTAKALGRNPENINQHFPKQIAADPDQDQQPIGEIRSIRCGPHQPPKLKSTNHFLFSASIVPSAHISAIAALTGSTRSEPLAKMKPKSSAPSLSPTIFSLPSLAAT